MANGNEIGTTLGSVAGGAIGSALLPGIGTSIGAGLGGLAGGALGGLFGRKKPKETETQRKQRELVDEMIASLHGNGPFSDLFNPSEADFERSFAEPARSRFRNQTAPMIQQQYIASGQQRSTGLEDTLARAGVDMDALLNESYMDYLNQGRNRQVDAMGNILGLGAGVEKPQGYGEAAMQGLGGYVSSPSFGKDIGDIISSFKKQPQYRPADETYRKGFENDVRVSNPLAGSSVFGGY